MVCANCQQTAHHIMSSEYGEHCENCSELSLVSGVKTDGILTRNSWRVRRQQSRFEGDIVRPHIYDKANHREHVNPDFLKLYPDKVKEYFKPEELIRDGYKDMPAKIEANKKRNDKKMAAYRKATIFSGSTKKAMEKFLK
jgi:hypothetical protein